VELEAYYTIIMNVLMETDFIGRDLREMLPETYYTIIMDVLMVLTIFALVLAFLYLVYGKEKIALTSLSPKHEKKGYT